MPNALSLTVALDLSTRPHAALAALRLSRETKRDISSRRRTRAPATARLIPNSLRLYRVRRVGTTTRANSTPHCHELPPSGVSRDVVFGASHDTIWLVDCSCCSGGSNPICIPVWRAAGWFGVDPPHLRWAPPSRGALASIEGVEEPRGGSGRARELSSTTSTPSPISSPPGRCGIQVERTCTCWVPLRHVHNWLCEWLDPVC